MPEACADLVRTAAGNGHLLVRKKISTFNGLVQKHLHPVVGDPMPVLLADLEAFWVTIDMELTGINKQFEKIEQYRKAGWNMEAVEETTSTETTPKASTAAPPVPKKSRLPTKKSPALSAEAQEKLDKQRALANERRAKAMAEMRARGKQQQKTSVEPAAADIEC
ncbi:unnamed protein product [Caenorhabditis auriculariae]|uniref:Uncharacterized protein n=1 Tax=Caenorhabditis auriculariae TaxID=2777116 RepID=A0A8S1HNU1_9PELO|nr:unnamed protein product [Caenorhabditis auriculariae]